MKVKTTVEFTSVEEAAGWLCQYTTSSYGLRANVRRQYGITDELAGGRDVAREAVRALARKVGLRIEGDAPVIMQGAPQPSWIDAAGNVHLLSEMPDTYLRNCRPFAQAMARHPGRTPLAGRGLLDAIDKELERREEEAA
jgi:hypothetical protein